jgi:hypothetical protein
MKSDGNNGRTTAGRFSAGNEGRPKGARHKATLAIEALLDGEAEGLTRKVIELALEGDTTALRLCLDRIAPTRKGRTVSFTLPPIIDARDALPALDALLQAVADGELTTDEAAAVAGLIETKRRLIETIDLEIRITNLEDKSK